MPLSKSSFQSALTRIVLRDGRSPVRLCRPDLILADLAYEMVLHDPEPDPKRPVAIEVPRGEHEISVSFALAAQLARLQAKLDPGSSANPIRGSIIVIGTDTAVHARIGDLSVQGIPLDQGLRVHRVRSDGQIVPPTGQPIPFNEHNEAVLYLNTRVGWPRLLGERDGITIIDRTSFSSPNLLRKAIDWAKTHCVRRIVIFHNHGDPEVQEPLRLHWILDRFTLASLNSQHLSHPIEENSPRSKITLRPLVGGNKPTLQLARVEAPYVQELSRSIYQHIKAARDVDSEFPMPILAAMKFLSISNMLAGEVSTYDQAAAVFAQPLRDLVRRVDRGHDQLRGVWSNYRETKFAALKADIRELYRALESENPKFEALLFLIDQLKGHSNEQLILVRTVNDAAAFALEEDVLKFDPTLATNVRFTSMRHRLLWDDKSLTEVLTGLPSVSNRPLIWSGETRCRLLLCYGWEAFVMGKLVSEQDQRIHQNIPPELNGANRETIECPTVFYHNVERPSDNAPPPTFEIDITEVIGELDPDVDQRLPGSQATDAAVDPTHEWSSPVRPITLQPNGEIWLVPEDSELEVVLGSMVRRVPSASVQEGAEVILPRGAGRESLFARALMIIEGQGSYIDVEFVLRRWRQACRRLLEAAGSVHIARHMLREAGAETYTQLEAWAEGTTLAPNEANDMLVVAELVEDEWLKSNWRRVAKLVSKVRGTHIRLGQTISGAMREAASGGGPNLTALADLLGVDASSIIDEFELRVVQSVGNIIYVKASQAGTMLPPGSLNST